MEVATGLHGKETNDRKKMDIFTTDRMRSQIFYLGLIEHMSEEPVDVEATCSVWRNTNQILRRTMRGSGNCKGVWQRACTE